MSDRIVLHIGAMKTGTTFLQTSLERNSRRLRDAGIDFTGNRFAFQTRAVSGVLNSAEGDARGMVKWRKLARAARQADETVSLVSMEFLSFATEQHIEAFLAPLRRLPVEIVMTVRDQFQVTPAQWQTYCRNHGTSPWGRYLREIEPRRRLRGRSSTAFRTFHRAQDIEGTLRRWSSFPQVTDVHIVTVPGPEAPPEELWLRFFDAVGVAPPAVDFGVAAPNTSLGYGSCDLLRRLNRHLGDVPGSTYRQGMRKLAREVLAGRRGQESRPVLDRRGAAYARSLNARLRDGIARHGYRVHGDLDDLPVPGSVEGFPRRAAAVPRAETYAAAGAAWQYLSGRAGGPDMPPRAVRRSLSRLVADDARLLRRVNGWDLPG